jgi:AraC family transcriptional regulator, regulatory protein of adaptative response / methylated-DNA-[protein]-cysteine methyltransferase
MNSYRYKTPAGILTVSIKDGIIYQAQFDDVNEYPDEVKLEAEAKLGLHGTQFQKKVWEATQLIPAGKTITYQELAAQIGQPKAYRAVASALANNKIAYFIPCHRVIRSDGSLGGYKWGLERKKLLLAAEKK